MPPARVVAFSLITWPDPGAEALVQNKVVDAFSVHADGNDRQMVAMRSKGSETATVIVGKLPAGIVLSKRLETELG